MSGHDRDAPLWFKPGDPLGDYEIVRVLDRGTFSYNLEVQDLAGRVFHGIVHCREDLRPEVTLSGIRFEARLSHPGLPKIEHVGVPCEQSRGHVWFVREFLDRPLAYHVWTSGETLSADEVLQIGRGVCELLEYLHDPAQHAGRAMVHGFLVPGYIHRAHDGTVKVAGLDVQTLVRAGIPAPLRHLAYRCPECLERSPDELTPANDLWALAACLLFLATARSPIDYQDVGIEELRRAHEEQVPPLRARQVADLRLQDILLRAFAANPRQRFQSASEFRLAIAAQTRRKTNIADQAFSSQTVITHYPAPIAVTYQRLFRQEDPSTRLQMLFLTLEATLRYLVTLGVSDLFHCFAVAHDDDSLPPDETAFDFLRKHKNMTLGAWRNALGKIACILLDRADRVVRELPETCRSDGPLLKTVVDRLVQTRNTCVHLDGSIAITPEECREVIREARPVLDEILQRISFVRNYPLGFVRRSPLGSGRPELHCYRAYSCMGSRVAHTAETKVAEVPMPLQEDWPFMVAPDGSRLLYLWPLLRQRISSQSQRHCLYVFEEIPDGQSWLAEIRSAAIDIRESWREQLHGRARSLAWLIQRLRALPAVVDLPQDSQLAAKLLPSHGGKLVGRVLGSNRLLAAVATGGFATVYAAESAVGQRLAVKVIESPEALRHFDRFWQEFAKLRKAGDHAGIIRTYERGTEVVDGQQYPWYSMEFALGGDLANRIVRRRSEAQNQLPWLDSTFRDQIAREFAAIVEAVAHLHRLGIVHRDIKPSNVLIMEDGTLRLSDFGLIKDLAPSEQSFLGALQSSTGAVFGTRHYMAPEQERGKVVNQRADVYSLGILLAELAAGQRPETDTHVAQGTTLHRWKSWNGLPKALAKIIRCCTDIEPARRYQDATELARQFDRVLAKPADAKPPEPDRATPRSAPRRADPEEP